MQGDFSRLTFDPRKHYRSVRMQQGRVQLDADWNEQIDILNYFFETQLKDILGSSGASQATAGFKITTLRTPMIRCNNCQLSQKLTKINRIGSQEPGIAGFLYKSRSLLC